MSGNTEKSVDQEKSTEDMSLNQNQDADRNPESNFENNMSEPEISEVPSSDNVEQPTESPTWAEAELEDDDEGFVDVVDAPAHAESSLESEASQAIAEALKQEITALKTQLEDQESKYTRMYADFENFRKRTQKEREDMEQSVKCSTLTELLPVVDNFERARSQIKPQTDAEMNIHKSYQSVYKQLVDCLKRVGVSPMRAEGNPFDPALHEAVMREPTAEHPEGTVLEELMRGYMLGDRVIRHAMVKVAAEPEEQEGDPGQPPQAEEES